MYSHSVRLVTMWKPIIVTKFNQVCSALPTFGLFTHGRMSFCLPDSCNIWHIFSHYSLYITISMFDHNLYLKGLYVHLTNIEKFQKFRVNLVTLAFWTFFLHGNFRCHNIIPHGNIFQVTQKISYRLEGNWFIYFWIMYKM